MRLTSWLLIVLSATAHALPDENYSTSVLAKDLRSPWSMEQLTDDQWVISEREGSLVFVEKSAQTRYSLSLKDLYVAGQGGLLDVVPAPDYAQSQTLFISYAQGNANANRLVIAKVQVSNGEPGKVTDIFKINTDKSTPVHYAGRLLFLPDGTLLFTSGDGFDYREQAQVLGNHLGKTLRINTDGSIPQDNPFLDPVTQQKSAVYSLGHRNTQGLIYVPQKDLVLSHEHGPAGGDELNIIQPGNNYGWPVITEGMDYSGARISPFRDYPGMVKPVVDWTPSIAPSGMASYYGPYSNGFPSLYGHALVTTLVDKRLYAVEIDKGDYLVLPVFDKIQGRLRDVKTATNGDVAVLTDGDNAQLLILAKQP